MQLKVPKKFGKRLYEFLVEGDNLHQVLMESEKLSFGNVDKCGICESDNLRLRAYITEKGNFEYVKCECYDCRASLTFGKRKDVKDTYYLRKNDAGSLEWQAYEPERTNNKKFNENDSIPF